MATSADPLRRDQVAVQARDTGDRYQPLRTNSALSIAASLKDLQPELSQTLGTIATQEADKAKAQARKDAIANSGAKFADAVRDGKLKPTQNPWYMQAYAREGASIRASSALSDLQTQSTAWAERNDPKAFEKKWREGVAAIAGQFSGEDESAGFTPVEGQFTQQTLASNVSLNAQRIVTERTQNVTALTAQAIAAAASANGGKLSAEATLAAVAPAYTMWTATGGSEADWHKIFVGAVTSASYSTSNPDLIDVTKAIGLDGKPVLDGEFGGGGDTKAPNPAAATPAPALAGTALPAERRMPVVGGRISSAFGVKRGGLDNGGPHPGLDIAVPVGTPVTSPGAGTVVEAGNSGKLGNFVRVDYGGGIVAVFGHLSKLSTAKGAQVNPGDVLALSGGEKGAPGAGNSRGPHLHWGVRINGSLVNPQSVAFPQGFAATPAAEGAKPTGALAAVIDRVNNPDAPPTPDGPAVDPNAPPPQAIARGPSLYDIAGVADAAESDRYRIEQAQTSGITKKLQAEKALRQVRGQEGSDMLLAEYGEKIYAGQYDPSALRSELRTKGFSEPDIGEVLRNLREVTGDSASLSNNRVAINGSNPSKAVETMRLMAEGQRDGYSPGYEARVSAKVLSGDISGDDGTRMVTSSISRSQQIKSEARADERADRQATKDSGAVYNATSLRFRAETLASKAAEGVQTWAGKAVDPKRQAEFKRLITMAMTQWLASHPGDWAGAETAGENFTGSYIGRLRTQAERIGKQRGVRPTTPSSAPAGGNPLR